MSRLRVALVGSLLSCLCLCSTQAATPVSGGSCYATCNTQHNATLRYCKETQAKTRRSDWYADCVKNAARFRSECLRRCR